MKDKVLIAIPTLGRADRQPTLESIPKSWINNTRLVIHKSEKQAYSHFSVHKFVTKKKGIHKVRQAVFDYYDNMDFIIFLSDDMKFFKRKKGPVEQSKAGLEWRKLEQCTKKDVGRMLQDMVNYLKGMAHVGISQRQFNHTVESTCTFCGRMHDAYGYRMNVIRELGIRFDRLEVMEDMDVTLQLIRAGYNNMIFYDWAWDQMHSNAAGGCSIYRNNDLQSKCAEKLKTLHPDFVTVVTKNTKSWKGMEVRKDVRIKWKKALLEGETREYPF